MKEVNGVSIYKGTIVQQHNDFQVVFSNFLNKIKPKRILEIGFGTGAFTLFLRDHLNEIGLHETQIKSYDTNDITDFHNSIQKLNNIELLKNNIFSGVDYTFINDETVIGYIQSEGVTLILCDGGNKQKEFQQLSKFMKNDDIIMAHDYIDTEENFQKNYFEKIWNWREIGDEHIENICKSQNLFDYDKEIFDKIVWVCKRKKTILTELEFENLCNKIEDCFFLQIGANDGISVDPIYKIVKQNNWSGLLVEPGFESYQQLLKNYSDNNNLLFEMSAISDIDGDVTLYCGTSSPHFTMDFEIAKWMFGIDPIPRKVPSLSPTSLINKFSIQKIDLLQIDTEGHDFVIIQNFPFDKIKPKIVRYEITHLNNKIEESINFMKNLGYTCYSSEDGADIISLLKN